MAGWSAREMGRLLNIPSQTLTYWIANGLVTPDRRGHGRRGHVIGVNGLMEILCVKELREANFSLQEIRTVIDHLRDLTGQERPLIPLDLVAIGREIAWHDRGEVPEVMVSALRNPGQRIMVFPVGEMHAAILRQLDAGGNPRTSSASPDGKQANPAGISSRPDPRTTSL